ncbi:MAG TPA: sigma-70 family RNA polymerase sigma factor [Sphingobacteriaceae bacterium]
MWSEPDKNLIHGLHEDDVSAFDALYWKYHQPVFRNIIRLTRDAEAARDILQEVYSKLWEKRYEINEHQSVSGWLFVLSYNQSITYLRKTLRESVARNKIEILPADSDDLENLNLLESQHQLLQLAIEKLSPQKRKVFTLCKIEGKSYEQAAQELNISKHTVKEYLSLSLISIREYVNNHPEVWRTAIAVILSDLFN